MVDRVSDGDARVLDDDFDALHHTFGNISVLDEFDDDGAERGRNNEFVALGFVVVFFVDRVSDERINDERFGVRGVDVLFDAVLDLAREVGRVAGVDDRFVRFDNGGGEVAEQFNRFGAFVDHILTAHRLDLGASSSHHGERNAVALDESTAFVGDGVEGLFEVERFMDIARKVFELRPEALTIAEIFELTIFVIVGGVTRYLTRELEEPLLSCGVGVGTLEDFDQTDLFQLGFDDA